MFLDFRFYKYIYLWKLSEEPNYLDKFNLDFTTSKNTTIKVECEINSLIKTSLLCSINIILYPLEDVHIYLLVKPPQKQGYSFPNWETIIGADPGTSNKISDITCLPKETNIFKITSIKTVWCSGKKNVFNLYGEWEDETNFPILDFDTEFYLSNENKDLW